MTVSRTLLVLVAVLGVTATGCTGGHGGARPSASGSSAATTPGASATGPGGSPTTSPAGSPTASSPTTTLDPVAACVDRALGRMTVSQRAAQLVMVGVPSTGAGSSLRATLRRWQPGSVILMDRTTRGVTSVAAAVRRTTAAVGAPGGARPVVAVDQEGGQVLRLTGPGFAPMPSAKVQSGWSTATLQARATTWGRELRAAGVTLDLAPVADVVPPDVGADNDPVAGLDRGYGDDPQQVSTRVQAVVRGLRAGGVDATVKHFPGLGRVRSNTDFAADAVDRDTRRGDPLLAPFAAGTRAGAGWLMVSLATYPRIDPRHVGAFSSTVVEQMVRHDLGFDGVVVSDDLGRAVAVRDVPAGQRAVRFLRAGGDVALTVEPSLLPTMVRAVVAEAGSDPAFRAAVDAKVRRVLRAKATVGLLRCGE